MKKMIAILVIIMFTLSGCSSPAYQAYNESNNRTASAHSGKSSFSINVEMEFNEEGLSEADKEQLQYLKSLETSYKRTFDKKAQKEIWDIYGTLYGMGINAKVYQDKDKMFVLTSILPKVIMFESNNISNQSVEGPQLSTVTMEGLREIWAELITRENVATIGNIIVSTPEGDIKTKEFNLKFTEQELKPVLRKSALLVAEDESLKKMIKSMGVDTKLLSEGEIDKLLERVIVHQFSQQAFIDKDNYIVEEIINMDISIRDTIGGELKNLKATVKIQNWDINRAVKIEIPNIKPEDTIVITPSDNYNFEELFKAPYNNNKSILPSEELEPYPPYVAYQNGDIVNENGKISDLDRIDEFIENVKNGHKDKIRAVLYTNPHIEWKDCIIQDLYFDGEYIHLTYDDRRNSASPSKMIRKFKFTNIIKEETDAFIQYYLTKDTNEPMQLSLLHRKQ